MTSLKCSYQLVPWLAPHLAEHSLGIAIAQSKLQVLERAFGGNKLSLGLWANSSGSCELQANKCSDGDVGSIVGPLVRLPCILGLQFLYPILARHKHTCVCGALFGKHQILLSLGWLGSILTTRSGLFTCFFSKSKRTKQLQDYMLCLILS